MSEKLKNRKLTPKQARLANLLACGYSQRSAAKEIQVTEHTVSRWLSEDNLKEALSQKMHHVGKEAERLLCAALSEAVQALLNVLKNPDTAPVVKVNAARAVLNYGLKFREQGELVERISTIEKKLILLQA
jgi:transposase